MYIYIRAHFWFKNNFIPFLLLMHFCFDNIGLLCPFFPSFSFPITFSSSVSLSLSPSSPCFMTFLLLWAWSLCEGRDGGRKGGGGERKRTGKWPDWFTEDWGQQAQTPPLLSSLPFFLRPSTFSLSLSLSLSPLPLAVWYGSKNRKQWNTKNRERETDREKSIWRAGGI